MITVHYSLTQTGQKAALLAGLPATVGQTLQAQPTPEWVARATIAPDGTASVTLPYPAAPFDTLQTIESLDAWFAEYEAAAAAEAAKGAARQRAVIAAWIAARSPEERALPEVEALQADPTGDQYAPGTPWGRAQRAVIRLDVERKLAAIYADAATTGDEAAVRHAAADTREGMEVVAAESRLRELRKRRADAAALAAEHEWIATHGSPRLQRLLRERMDYALLYREERLPIDRPGWLFEADVDVAGRWTDREAYLPTEAEFAALDAAQRTVPDATLRRVTVYRPAEEGEEGDKDGDVVAARGHALCATFLGKTIWLAASMPRALE